MKNYKIAVAGTGYVGLSIATLLSQHHQVIAVDVVPEKVDLINNRKSPIQDDYIEKYLAEKELNLTAKDEPQLFIEVCEKEKSDKEFYRPETYFSTAQLNTVAFSSFFGRALSVSNLPIKTICIDDPIGHFDDMNILGFTDMIRCILEKQDCQIIMSTHEEKVYQIMKRKLDPNFYNTSFIQLDNSKKVVWDKTNC